MIVSVADVYSEVSKMMSESVDPHYLGELNIEHWSVGMERALAFREAGNDHRFYDMHFRAVQRDPIAEVRGLYEWLGAYDRVRGLLEEERAREELVI